SFFFSSRRRHTRFSRDWSSDVCSSDLKLYEHESLVALFEDSFKRFRDRVAFENMGTTITYGELDELSSHFAAFLQDLGMQKGERSEERRAGKEGTELWESQHSRHA